MKKQPKSNDHPAQETSIPEQENKTVQTTDTLALIRSAFALQLQAYHSSRKELEKKIATRQQQQERLQQRLQKTYCPRWTEQLLRPVLDEIKKQLTGWECDDDELTPMGLGCRVSVFFTKKGLPPFADPLNEENSIYIIFLPGELDKGELRYETGETTERYAGGTMGEVNGFNHVTKPLESIEEAIAFLQAQIKG